MMEIKICGCDRGRYTGRSLSSEREDDKNENVIIFSFRRDPFFTCSAMRKFRAQNMMNAISHFDLKKMY